MWIILWLTLAVVFTIYGILIRAVGSGTGFFMIWIAMALIMVGFAGAAKLHLRSELPLYGRGLFLTAVALAAGLFIAAESCVISCFFQQGRQGLDYIIVLGAQIYEDRPSLVLQYRLDAAADYLKDNPETICIVSGGQGANEPFPEAVGMRNYLEKMGIAGERILMEEESKNTDQNISNSKELMREGASVGIVTNNFHLYRGLLTARRQGLKDACGIAAGSNPWYLPNNMLREFFGVWKYWLKR